MKKIATLGIYAAMLCGSTAAQVNKGLDKTFGKDGIATTAQFTDKKFKWPTGLLLQQDGKILFSGNLIARYKTDGTPDSSFGVNGFFVPPHTDLYQSSTPINAQSIALQSDGKIVSAGIFDTGCSFLYRVLPSGTIDSSFNENGIAINSRFDVRHIKVRPDDKIIVVGLGCGNEGPSGDSVIIGQYLKNGSLDTQFGDKGFTRTYLGNYGGSIAGLGILPDGRIMMGGIGHDSGYTKTIALRYLPDGRPDSSLGGMGRIFPFYAWYCHAVAVLPDGRMLLTLSDGTNREDVARLHSDGKPDTSFGKRGFMGIDGLAITTLLPLSDGRIFCGGAQYGDFAVGSLNRDGKGVDSTFGIAGTITTDVNGYSSDYIHFLAVQPNQKILSCGRARWDVVPPAGVTLVRYNTNAATSSPHSRAQNTVIVYPNPAKSQVYVSGLRPDEIMAVQVITMDGRVLTSISSPSHNSISIDNYPPGCYLLRIVQQTGLVTFHRFTISP